MAFTRPSDIKSGIIVPKGSAEMLRAGADGMEGPGASGRQPVLMTKCGLRLEWLIPIEMHP